MTDIIRLRDTEGRVHHTARDSQAAEQLLRDGALDLDAPNDDTAPADSTPEVTDAAPSGQGDDHDTGASGGGSGKRQRTPRTSDGGDGPTGQV